MGRVSREADHSDDVIHRREDLITHVSEEFALGPSRDLGGDLRGRQFLLGSFKQRTDLAKNQAEFTRSLGIATPSRHSVHHGWSAVPLPWWMILAYSRALG